MKIITIQPASFVYNVWVGKDGNIVEGKKLPYPFHVDVATGDIERQDFWQGDPALVLGFQMYADRQQIDLLWTDAQENPDEIVGMFPVMRDDNGNIYTYTLAIESVTVTER